MNHSLNILPIQWMRFALFLIKSVLQVRLRTQSLLASIVILMGTSIAHADTFSAGAYIIDMGAQPQTYNNAIKPYGLIYDLVINNKVPVFWSINPNKAKDGVDFNFNGKDYRGGSFIIPALYASDALAAIGVWKAKGVVVDGPTTADLTAPIFDVITSFPNSVLDTTNGNILEAAFYVPAELPTTSYRRALPGQINACDDIFVLPHADPNIDWDAATVTAFKNYIYQGGYLWAGCHSGSALEDSTNGGLGLHFLSQTGLIHFDFHQDSTPPFTYSPTESANPIMQFLGTMDDSFLNGSEQVYLPEGGSWRSTTTVAISDPLHPDVSTGLSPGEAAIVAYGRAEGNSNYGKVLYQASHDIADAGTEAEKVAAARIFGNFLLLAGIEQQIQITDSVFPKPTSPINPKIYSVTAPTATSFQWTNSCGGTFSPNANVSSVTFHAPTTAVATCIVRVLIEDACDRTRLLSSGIPKPKPPAFSCSSEAYVTHSVGLSTSSDISSVDLSAGTLALEKSAISPNNINAIGYNIMDHLIWGYDRDAQEVVRIDSQYNVSSYAIPGLPPNSYHIGDVSSDGVLYLAEKHITPNKIYRVDVNEASPTYLQILSTITLSNSTSLTSSDFAFHPGDGMIYMPTSTGDLIKIDPQTGAITTVGAMLIAGYKNANVAFFDNNGYLYINNTSTNTIYQIDLTNPAVPNPQGVIFSTMSIPKEADGARCPNAPITPPVGSSLTLVHKVINDNGGVKTQADFGLSTTAGGVVFDAGNVAGSTTTYTSNPVLIPTAGAFDLLAPEVLGYSQTSDLWMCASGTLKTLVLNNLVASGSLTGNITIPDGDNVTCTVTYDDTPPCGKLAGEVNVAISPISILKSETLTYNNKLFIATTNNDTKKGHLRAYPIGADELPSSTSSWDAASVMTTAQRGSRLFSTTHASLTDPTNQNTQVNQTTLTKINTLPDASFQNTGVPDNATIKSTIIAASMGRISPNSTVTLLEKDVKPFLYLNELDYRTFYTATISKRSSESGATAPSQVLVTSDDGFLYSFKQNNGALNWGWMPPSLVRELKQGVSFEDNHFMQGIIEQLDLKSGSAATGYSFDSYIIGSYRDGLGHFILKLDSAGGLASVVWDTDYKSQNALADSAPNHGKRAYFSDANGIQYMAYIVTSSGIDSVLYLKKMSDNSPPTEVMLGFTATSSPLIIPDFKKSSSPVKNTIYLGDSNGNIYSAPIFANDNLTISTSLSNHLGFNASAVGTLHPTGQTASPILYIDVSLAKRGQYLLYAQAQDRMTVFKFDPTTPSWSQSWTTSDTGAGKWTTINGTTSYVADSSIMSLPANSRITDQAYIIASSIVLPITEEPDANQCHGNASYYLYRLTDGNKPVNTFFNTDEHTAITSGVIGLGKGETKRMFLTTRPDAKKLIALGLADQDALGNTGVSNSFYINDPITSGIRSWKELH